MKTKVIKLTAAVVLNGGIQKRGATVEVESVLADNLIYRGRAELVGSDEAEGTEVVNIGKMRKPELVQLATEYGIENADDLTVDELREHIKQAVENETEQ